MKKYILFSDVHWSQYSSIVRKNGDKFSVRLENLIDSMNWVESLGDKNEADEYICLGDFFDTPSINAQEITALQEVKWRNKKHRFIVGNHESNVMTLEYSSTKVFESINSEVISEPEIISVNDYVDFIFIPYLMSDKIKPISEYLPKNNKKKVVFAHQDLSGIRYGKFESTTGFNINDVSSNCTLFIDGHLHNHQIINNNIILIGNLTGQNFNEDAQRFDHLAYVLTVSDEGVITLDPYVNPYSQNFYKIRIEEEKDLLQLSNLKSNSVLSVMCNSKYISKAERLLSNNRNVLEYRLTIFYSSGNYSQEDKEDFTVEDHLKQFIEYAHSKLESSSILDDELSKLGGN